MNKEEKTLKENLIFDGRIVRLYKDDVLTPNNIKTTREYLKHNGGVCILAFVDGKIPFVKQYRYAYREEMFELPAGKLEKGEQPLEAAIREYEEETGYKPINITELGSMYPSCGYSNEVIHLYFASEIVKGTMHLDEDENLDLYYFSLEEVEDMIKKGQIKDAKTICLIYHYLRTK